MDILITDLDNTLYPKESGVFLHVDRKINQFMENVLGIAKERVNTLRRRFFEVYGTTLMGLMVHYGVDPEEYLSYVHDVPIEKLLSKDPKLRETLSAIESERFIFTNATKEHAERVLDALGVLDMFSGIFDIRSVDFMPKSTKDAHMKVLKSLKGEGRRVIYIDDYPRNLAPAKELGLLTILVGEGEGPDGFADFKVKSFYEVKEIYVQLHH